MKRVSVFSRKRKKSKWKRKWIPRNMKKGALSRQLGIPEKENIPVTLLKKIKNAKVGSTITNPTKTGKRKIKVTRKLKRRAVIALTLKRLSKRKKKKRKKRK